MRHERDVGVQTYTLHFQRKRENKKANCEQEVHTMKFRSEPTVPKISNNQSKKEAQKVEQNLEEVKLQKKKSSFQNCGEDIRYIQDKDVTFNLLVRNLSNDLQIENNATKLKAYDDEIFDFFIDGDNKDLNVVCVHNDKIPLIFEDKDIRAKKLLESFEFIGVDDGVRKETLVQQSLYCIGPDSIPENINTQQSAVHSNTMIIPREFLDVGIIIDYSNDFHFVFTDHEDNVLLIPRKN
jgi:alanyl-tRNA synthetase